MAGTCLLLLVWQHPVLYARQGRILHLCAGSCASSSCILSLCALQVAGAASCEFGAEQAILVRDEGAKERLQAQIGQSALVLTALEAKGLEFQVGSGWCCCCCCMQWMFRCPCCWM